MSGILFFIVASCHPLKPLVTDLDIILDKTPRFNSFTHWAFPIGAQSSFEQSPTEQTKLNCMTVLTVYIPFSLHKPEILTSKYSTQSNKESWLGL